MTEQIGFTEHLGCTIVSDDGKLVIEVAEIMPKGDPLDHDIDAECWCKPEEHRVDGVAFIMHRHSKDCAHVSPTKGKH